MNKDYKVAMIKEQEFNLNRRELEYDHDNPYDELLINTNKFKRRRKKENKMNRKPRVFVVSRGIHDFSAAEKYGELYYLSDEMQLRLSTPAVLRQFTEILTLESSSEDLLLCTGLSFLNGFAAAIFAQLHGRVNFLVYNKVLASYHIQVVNLPDYLIQENKEHARQRPVVAS